MKKHPVIGLNMSLEAVRDEDRWELQMPLTYIDAVTGAGGLPVCIPPFMDLGVIPELSQLLDGIVFIGGDDYLPQHYGGHAQPEKELMPERRDHFDLALAKWALQETDLPVLGVCGGHQLISIAQGGALVQDIQKEWTAPKGVPPLPHAKTERPGASAFDFRHLVVMNKGSLVARTTKAPPESWVETNSFHHQAVKPEKPGKDLMVSAWTADGVVEAIEPAAGSAWARSGRFVLGVQWHPERSQDEEPHRRIFLALVAAAGKYKRP
ncbi:MAG: gamma-glutamyl-gamma-aminobutyrate hydrolase family protein [Syntrophales bacterium]|nr:gamma-glutamyl-gamma-aminobutyrate hydrolase family protein [Syntrophales bacterium]